MGPKLQSKKTERKIVHIQTDRQKDILTYRQTHLHTDRQTDIQNMRVWRCSRQSRAHKKEQNRKEGDEKI